MAFVGVSVVGPSHTGRAAISRRNGRSSAMRRMAAVENSSSLDAFSKMVRGEWVGQECSFNAETGDLEDLPEGYVPEEFAAWGVKPKGFDSNHSSIVRGDRLYRKHIRVLPTVDSLTDQIDMEEENFQHDLNESGVSVFECGSYISVPTKVQEIKSLLDKVPKMEVCLRDSVVDVDRRIVAVVKFDFGTGKLWKSLQMFQEKFDMDFADGQFVECGNGFRSGWGEEKPVERGSIEGSWQDIADESKTRSIQLDGPEMKVVLLPRGLHIFSEKKEGGELTIELGWLVGEDVRHSMSSTFSADGTFAGSKRSVERKQ